MSYCGEQCAVKFEEGGQVIASLKCNAWTCTDCADHRKRRLIAEACGGAPTTFLTLTSRKTKNQTAAEAAVKLSHAWRLLRLRIMRKYRRKKLPFLAVFEKTKQGWPHLHLILRTGWIDRSFISEVMRELTDSPVIDIRKADNAGRVAVYITSYVSKDPYKFDGTKRYWQSQDYDLRPDPEKKDTAKPGFRWELWSMPMWRYLEMCITWDYDIISDNGHVAHVRKKE